MPNKIKPKRSYTANSVPLTTDLEQNELAINWADGKAFTKNASGQIVSVTLGGSGGGGGGSSSLVTAATVAGFPAAGSTANLYVATDTNRIYRWDSANSIYVELGPLASSGDTLLRSYLVPTAPSNVVATAGNAQVALSWTAASSLSQIPITDYLIQSSTDNGTTWALASDTVSTATSATITGLTNGTAYRFRVAAVNGVGTGAYSAASSAVTPVNAVVVDYLVVAGGGGGGRDRGGGGGAGGLLSGSMTATPGTQYAITVGGGGTGATSNSGPASQWNGSNSTALGYTAIGGGGGGSGQPEAAASGGSGGGASDTNAGAGTAGAAGTSGQGNSGGAAYGGYNGTYWTNAGGGGGAGAAGQNGGDSVSGSPGAGGIGVQWNGTYYAGGGGGSYDNRTSGKSGGAGGNGGGGAGGNGTGTSGTANRGGGGGGGEGGVPDYNGGPGGSGVVIIRSPVAAALTEGNPTVTTSGGTTIYTFTGSGSITF